MSLVRRLLGLGEGFPAGLIAIVLSVVVVAICAFATDSLEEFGATLGLVLAATAAGALAGLLIGSPGAGSGDEGTEGANIAGWASRIGVFGTWLTGAAFALVVANAGEIVDWFASLTRTVATTKNSVDVLLQYTLGALLITGASLGVTLGFMAMVTHGRIAITDAERVTREAKESADEAKVAADQAKGVAIRMQELGILEPPADD